MVQIRWTKLATEDLKIIHDYISKDSPVFAKIQVIRLRARTKVLLRFQHAGKMVPELENEIFRELIENYRIICASPLRRSFPA
jgi:plasmid stabilization system protein ParE